MLTRNRSKPKPEQPKTLGILVVGLYLAMQMTL